MATFSLENFRSEILDGAGLSRVNRFEVYILPPPALQARYGAISNLTSLYIDQSSIPGLTINTKAYRIFGPAYQRPISSDYGGDGLTMTFNVDRNMNVRKFFEDWMHAIVDPETFTVGYQEDYITTIVISQLDEQNNSTYEVTLLEAFPRSMNIMELNNSAQNQTHRLNVTFAFRYWKRTGIEAQKNPIDIPRIIQRPEVPTFDSRLPDYNRQWNWSTGNLEDAPGSDLPPSA